MYDIIYICVLICIDFHETEIYFISKINNKKKKNIIIYEKCIYIVSLTDKREIINVFKKSRDFELACRFIK